MDTTDNLMDGPSEGTSSPDHKASNQGQVTHRNLLGYRYSCLLAYYPIPVFCLLLGGTVLCGVIATALYDLPDFSDPIKGFQARGTKISRRMFSYRNLNFPDSGAFRPLQRPNRGDIMRDAKQGFQAPQAVTQDIAYSNITMNARTVPSGVRPELIFLPGGDEDTTQGAEFCKLYPLSTSARMVLVPSKTKTLFSSEAMKSICSMENEVVRQHPSFTKACCRNSMSQFNDTFDGEQDDCTLSWSLGNVVAALNNRESCDNIQTEDVENTGQILQDCAPYYESGSLTELCETPQCQALPSKCIQGGLVYKIFHFLTPSSFVEEIKQGTFQLSSTIVFLPIEMLYSFDELWDLYKDVFENKVITYDKTKVAALELGLKYDLFASYLQADTLYLGLSAILVVIIINLYVRSPFITAMTLLNMIMSLTLAYFAYKALFQLPFFPFVNIAAAVLVIGIGADDTFVFVDIWKKARQDIAKKEPIYNRAAVVHETLKHASVTMFVTSFTTASALYASAVSSITAVKCFAIFAGTAIVANFIFTVTWLPVVVVLNDICSTILFGQASNKDTESGKKQRWHHLRTCCSSLSRFLNKVFTVHIQTLIFNLRIVWILLFLGLAIGGVFLVFVSPKLQLPSQSDFQVFRSSHQFEKYSSDFKKKYSFEDDRVDLLPYTATWGLQALDNGNHWDPESTGKVKYDDQFDLSHTESQEWLYNFCDRMRNQSFVNAGDQSYCFIENLKTTLHSPCTDETLLPPCCGRQDFPFPPDIFNNCAVLFCNATNCMSQHGLYRFGPWFDNGRLVAISVVATSTYKLSLDYNLMDAYWNAANTWTEDQMQTAPAGMSGGWFISHSLIQFNFYDLQGSLATGAPAAMGISLGLAAAVLLLTTRNILISLYAMVSISGAVFVTIGSLVLLGWQLNIFESAILSLAVGLSVDFTIHYGVGYRLAPFKDNRGRTEFSIETLAPAITVAAISTFAAGAMMMPATVVTYVQLGTFLMLVMTISWSYATFFFLALCRTIGPRGNIAQIPLPKCMQCNGSSADSNKSQDRIENGHVATVDREQNEPLNVKESKCNAAKVTELSDDDLQKLSKLESTCV
ncbi:protein dispatched homolog 1-like [Amphiura filiformis]|uniref:protein dispatched homolog 1-like n=1 Tax=Amphiura filiformis TaxID=82378 RepID=UPI003B227680